MELTPRDAAYRYIYDVLKDDKYAYQTWLDTVVRDKHSNYDESLRYDLEDKFDEIEAPEIEYEYDEAGEYCLIKRIDGVLLSRYLDTYGEDDLYLDIVKCIDEALKYHKQYLADEWKNIGAHDAIGDWITPIYGDGTKYDRSTLLGYKNEVTGRKTLF